MCLHSSLFFLLFFFLLVCSCDFFIFKIIELFIVILSSNMNDLYFMVNVTCALISDIISEMIPKNGISLYIICLKMCP